MRVLTLICRPYFFVTASIQLLVHDRMATVSNNETFIQDFREILKEMFPRIMISSSLKSSTTYYYVTRCELLMNFVSQRNTSSYFYCYCEIWPLKYFIELKYISPRFKQSWKKYFLGTICIVLCSDLQPHVAKGLIYLVVYCGLLICCVYLVLCMLSVIND